jgi:hypothetical protein
VFVEKSLRVRIYVFSLSVEINDRVSDAYRGEDEKREMPYKKV